MFGDTCCYNYCCCCYCYSCCHSSGLFLSPALDDVLDCVEAGHTSCASMTDFLIGTEFQGYASATICRPIYSRESTGPNGTAKVLGFTTVALNWAEELILLSHDILGVDCVLRSPHSNSSFTYFMHDGKVVQKEGGDQHDRDFDRFEVHVPLSLLGSHATDSATFVMDLYPTKQYRKSFQSNTPLYTSLGLAGMIVFTSVVFFLYDQLVKENVKEKAHVLRMKRDFVRFISHEIRTPLNTVAVGMTLLEEGLQMMHVKETLVEQISKGSPDIKTTNKEIRRNDYSQDERDYDDTKVSIQSSLSDQRDMSLTDMLELTSDVQNSTTVAVSVLNDLLNFDKLEAGEVKMAYETVYILDLVKAVVKSFKIQAYQKKIQMAIEVAGVDSVVSRDVVVRGDKFKLSHVIRNLMSNALKFTERNGKITVTITVLRPSSTLHGYDVDRVSHFPPTQTTRNMQCWPHSSFANHCCGASHRPDNSHYTLNSEIWGIDTRLHCNGMILVAVEDSGNGLSKEQLGALFQDGVQFDPNKLQAGQGSGLGLFLAQKIVTVHGGRIWADSKGQGMGATFFVSLPLAQAITTPEYRIISPTSAGGAVGSSTFSNSSSCRGTGKGNVLTEVQSTPQNLETGQEEHPVPMQVIDDTQRPCGLVLVVDDASSNRKIVKRVLKSRGFSCMEAKDGQECIQVVKDMSPSPTAVDQCTSFCCILMDFEMPILNGPDTIVALRDLGYKYPIYGLTGNVMQEDIQHFLESGANYVLSKPLDIAEFLSIYNGADDV